MLSHHCPTRMACMKAVARAVCCRKIVLPMLSVLQWFMRKAEGMCLQDWFCLFKTSRPVPTLGIPFVQANQTARLCNVGDCRCRCSSVARKQCKHLALHLAASLHVQVHYSMHCSGAVQATVEASPKQTPVRSMQCSYAFHFLTHKPCPSLHSQGVTSALVRQAPPSPGKCTETRIGWVGHLHLSYVHLAAAHQTDVALLLTFQE